MPTDTHYSVGYPIPWWAVRSITDPSPEQGTSDKERRDLVVWLLLTAAGLTLTLVAVRTGAQLGTASAPFLGFYRVSLGVATLLAPAVAAVVIVTVRDGLLERIRFGAVLAVSYVGALAWALALALAEGAAGLTRSLRSANNYLT